LTVKLLPNKTYVMRLFKTMKHLPHRLFASSSSMKASWNSQVFPDCEAVQGFSDHLTTILKVRTSHGVLMSTHQRTRFSCSHVCFMNSEQSAELDHW